MSLNGKQVPDIFSESGLTLIELMISLAIASILMVAIFSVYTGLTRSYTTETARAAAQQDIRSGLRLMARDIRLAGLDPLGSANAGFTISGGNDIEFTADLNYDGAITVGNLEQIRYFLNGTQLIQRLDNDNTTDEVLLDNVTALTFTYVLDAGGSSTMVVIDMTVQEDAGRTGTVSRSLTETVRIRNL